MEGKVKTCKDCFWSSEVLDSGHKTWICDATKFQREINLNQKACERFEPFKLCKKYWLGVIAVKYLDIKDIPEKEIEKWKAKYKKLYESGERSPIIDEFLNYSDERIRDFIFTMTSSQNIIKWFSGKSLKEVLKKFKESVEKKDFEYILKYRLFSVDNVKEPMED